MPKRKTVTEKYKGESFASAAKKVSEKYKNRERSSVEMNSYLQEMDLLHSYQERARTREIAMQSLKNYRQPANASRYGLGGVMKYELGGGPGDPPGSNPFISPARFLDPLSSMPSFNQQYLRNMGESIRNNPKNAGNPFFNMVDGYTAPKAKVTNNSNIIEGYIDSAQRYLENIGEGIRNNPRNAGNPLFNMVGGNSNSASNIPQKNFDVLQPWDNSALTNRTSNPNLPQQKTVTAPAPGLIAPPGTAPANTTPAKPVAKTGGKPQAKAAPKKASTTSAAAAVPASATSTGTLQTLPASATSTGTLQTLPASATPTGTLQTLPAPATSTYAGQGALQTFGQQPEYYNPDNPFDLGYHNLPFPGFRIPMDPKEPTKTPFVPKTTDPKDPKDPKGRNLYSPLIAGKGLQTLGQLAMLATGYDKVKPEYNPNEQRIEQLMANRNINTQALQNLALSQQNVALQNLSDVRSPGVRRALVNNVIQGTLKSMQQNRMQQDDMNNRYAAEYAQTLGSLGQQRVQANTYAEQANQQGKANFESGIQNMLATLGNTGQKLTDYKVNLAQQDLTASFLKSKDFAAALPSKFIGKIERGEDLDDNDILEMRKALPGKSAEEVETFVAEYREFRKKRNELTGK